MIGRAFRHFLAGFRWVRIGRSRSRFPEHGIRLVGVSLAFGLTVLTMAYAVGGISGGHFNPAVSLGLAIGNRFSWGELIPYWVAQVVGAIAAALVLLIIASGAEGWTAGGFAPISIGLALTLIHLISIPVTNTSVNPARSTGVGLFAETGAMGQLWLFWVAPLIGAGIGGAIWRFVLSPDEPLEGIGGEGEVT